MMTESEEDSVTVQPERLSNTVSPLLRLPAELRSQIYEHVLCNRTIHIGIRRRGQQETGGYAREHGSHIKLLHAVCLSPSTWEEAYRLSKLPDPSDEDHFDERGHLKLDAVNRHDVLRSYYTEHKDCNMVLHDFQWQDYMAFPDKPCRCPFPCVHYFDYRRRTIDEFGNPPQGLKLKHAASKFDLALLQTCRQIHQETKLLPYTENTFSFQNRLDIDLFLDKVLNPAQRNAVRRINICIRSVLNPPLPTSVPQGLSILECFMINDSDECHDDLKPWRNLLDNVQVISGWDGKRSLLEERRCDRRREAEVLERYLTKDQTRLASS